MRQRLLPFVFCLLLSLVAPVRGEVVNRILATVDGEPITMHELSKFTERNVRARQLANPDKAMLLDALITDRIIQKEVSDQGIVVRDEDVDRYIDGIKERNKLDDAQLNAALSQQGVTYQGYRTQVRDDLQKVQLINKEIRGKVNVSPEEVQRYYEAHLDEYAVPEGTTISHILLRVPDKATPEQVDAIMARANDLHKQLTGGANFSELARKYSEDAAAQDGGKLGSFKKGEMLETFETVVKSLKSGQISEPFRTPLGIHIARVDERSGAAHQPLDQLADEIKQKLYSAALEERYNRWLTEDLRQRHHLEMRP